MTNFVAGAVLGFLACAWAIGASPDVAVATLWQRLEIVQQTSAAAYEVYDAKRLAKEQRDEKLKFQDTDYH